MAGFGDWLTDQELDENIRAGNFDNDKRPADGRTDRPRKRKRGLGQWEEREGPSNATDPSVEGPTIPERSSQAKKTEAHMGDYVTDEELQALLEAGYLGDV